MERKRPITEDDILLTELLLARSFSNLKKSVVQATSDAASSAVHSAGGTIKKHPWATAGAAIGTGVILYGLFRLITRPSPGKAAGLKDDSPHGVPMEILTMILPVLAPYLAAGLSDFLGRKPFR